VAWFLGQSLLFILSAFLLGLLVGWLWWGRRDRRVAVEDLVATEQQVAQEVALAERLDEFARPAGWVEEPKPEQQSEPEPQPEPVAEAAPEPVAEAPPDPAAAPSEAAPSEAAPSEAAPVSGEPLDLAVEELPSVALSGPAADEVPADEIPADEIPADQVPADQAPADQAPADQAPADQAPADQAPADQAPVDEGAGEEAPGEVPAPDAEGRAVYFSPLVGSGARPESTATEATATEAPPADPEDPVAPEDLQRIEGIGPGMSGALHAAGIRTFRQLADADEATIRTAVEAAGLTFVPSLTTWPQQARLLADGDEDGFADLARRLVAGRDLGRA
jgi:predicted flap endonuclease-1-like 5' DNA nuclease